MRKIIITIIAVLLVILAFNMVKDKIQIGDIEIFGTAEIEKQNENLDKNIEQGKELVQTYNETEAKVDDAYEALLDAKEGYEEKVAVIAAKNTEEAKLLQNYTIEFLWIEIGLHRKTEGVELDLTLASSGSSTETDLLTNREVGIYDLQFKVGGTYEAITDFIYDIEGDSKLGFEIDDFKLNSDSDDDSILLAEFTCSDIRIYKDSLSDSSVTWSSSSYTTDDTTGNTGTDEDESTGANTTSSSTNSNSTNTTSSSTNSTNTNSTNTNSTNTTSSSTNTNTNSTN